MASSHGNLPSQLGGVGLFHRPRRIMQVLHNGKLNAFGSGNFLSCPFCQLCYSCNMSVSKGIEPRRCKGCGVTDREEEPHLRCHCHQHFCMQCLQSHCCSDPDTLQEWVSRLD